VRFSRGGAKSTDVSSDDVQKGDAAMRIRSIPSLLVLSLAAGCVSHGTMYSRTDAGRPWSVQEGTVVQVTEATIEGREQGYIGTFGGGYIGHAVGNSVGGGTGSTIAGAVGAVAGAIAGQKAEKVATQKRAWEILVKLEGGAETLAIVQPADQDFSTGEKVRIYTRSDGAARVAKL
jgi:outer membrane lipoprotein SlyB